MEEKPNGYFRILQSVQSSQQFSWISVCTAVIFSYLPLWRVPRSQECSLFHPLVAYGNCRILLFHFPFRLRSTLFCSVGKKLWVRIMWRKWTCHGDFLAGCSDCGKILPLMRFNARFTIQSAAVRDAEREKFPGSCCAVVSFFSREKLTLKQTGASKPAVEACWSLCEVSARPSRVFETSHTFIVEVSQPLVTFLCRSFQSWSRLISMTVFATSWTTLFLPSTSCINSSSTPV